MIDKNNFKDVLLALGFRKETLGNYYRREICDFFMAADFDNGKLIYPKGLETNANTTTNFSQNENFVVFECVCKLMEKGYQPTDVELEPVFRLGHHSKSSGRPDILIRDKEGENLIIIECKTAGKEYNKEKNNTETDGGQLFSYWQQDIGIKWLALYASDWDSKKQKITYQNDVINCTDDANILKMAERDKDIKVFANAKNDNDRFEVWRDTYNCQWLKDLLFSENSQAYQIQLKPLRNKDLIDFTTEDKIVNQFEEILRHNNVSDKENAFNRLVALFICKLVDEIKKQEFDEVDFQYKYTDTYETLQDRLQRLHQQGMKEFMKEDMFYVPDNYAETLFQQYTGRKRKEAIKELKHTIRILKFYSNNDFAFKDVHNEELFYQNGKILVEVVQLFQPYRIVYPSRHQFLGDLFEQLLNKGFKQNEGQFFTPMPITRFIWDSLPLQSYINEHDLPRVLDYACGAGHFLTEAVEAINAVRKDGNNSWVEKHIYGVEKDYRLARVSKVSMFMNGAGNSNIIFGDGLENYPDKDITPQSFDILVANPPYAVKDFKRHLVLHNNTFALLNKITFNGSEIETLFIERIAQVLKPCGIAAVILPASILSNASASYTAARGEVLKNFRLHAIVAFGNKTFGATGTNTVTLFLEKYNEPPRKAELVKDFVSAVMDGDTDNDDWIDKKMFHDYLRHQHVDANSYSRFINCDLDWKGLSADNYLKVYYDAFLSQKITFPKNITTAEEQEQYTRDKFYDFAIKVEQQKLYYFALAYKQETLVVTVPTNNKEQKTFLGYDWSNRNGDEGIKIDHAGGLLYDDSDRFARSTIACAIRNSFAGANTQLPKHLQKFVGWYLLNDLINFNSANFAAQINTKTINTITLPKSKFMTKQLGEIAQIQKGKPITENQCIPGNIKVVAGGRNYAYLHNQANRPADIITISASGAYAGYVNYWREPIYASDCNTVLGSDKLHTLFLYNYLLYIQDYIYSLQRGSAQPHVYGDDLAAIQIPLPPMNVQQQIVSECEVVDNDYINSKNKIAVIERYKRIIVYHIMRNYNNNSNSLSSLMVGVKNANKKIAEKDILPFGKYPVVTQETNKLISGYTDYQNPITDTPIIVFGDHTCIFKYVDFSFFRGADGTQLIKIDSMRAIPKYVYFILCYTSIPNSSKYERHFKYLKNIQIPILPIQQQKKIVSLLDAKDKDIINLKSIMANCSARKQAILDKYLK